MLLLLRFVSRVASVDMVTIVHPSPRKTSVHCSMRRPHRIEGGTMFIAVGSWGGLAGVALVRKHAPVPKYPGVQQNGDVWSPKVGCTAFFCYESGATRQCWRRASTCCTRHSSTRKYLARKKILPYASEPRCPTTSCLLAIGDWTLTIAPPSAKVALLLPIRAGPSGR